MNKFKANKKVLNSLQRLRKQVQLKITESIKIIRQVMFLCSHKKASKQGNNKCFCLKSWESL